MVVALFSLRKRQSQSHPTRESSVAQTSTFSSSSQPAASSSTTMSTAFVSSVSSTDTSLVPSSNSNVITPTSTGTSTSTVPPTTTTSTTTTATTDTSTTTTEPPPTTTTTTTSEPPPTTTTEPTTTSNPPQTATETTTSETRSASTSSGPPTTSTVLPPSTTISQPGTTFVAQETTLSSTFFFTVTMDGKTTTSVPSQFTSTLTSTGSNGQVSTITQIVVNPTLSSDGGGGGSDFLKNTGAVAGVFVIVGLAAASICIWIIFFIRRRRRKLLLEREAVLAARTGHRSPLEGEDEEPGMSHTAAVPITARPPSAYFDDSGVRGNDGGFDPYVGYPQPQVAGTSRDGYAPARTSSPPLAGTETPGYRLGGHRRQPSAQSNSGTSAEGGAHSRTYSFSSYEPLLTAAGIGNKTPPESPGPTQAMESTGDTGKPPAPPPRNPLRPTSSRSAEGGETEVRNDERLDPAMETRLARADTNASRIRDDEDYSRPVLGVRNVPSYTSDSEYSDDEK